MAVETARSLKPIKMNKTEILQFATTMGYPLKPFQVDRVHDTIHAGWKTIYYDGGRQITGKSHIQIVASLILAIAGRRILYTAHEGDAVRSMMYRFASLTEKLIGSDIVKKESLSNGFQEIFFTSGGFIQFKIRVDGKGVGGNFDVIIYDEAQMVSERAFSDMDNTVEGSEIPIRVHIGTPPKPDEYRLYPEAPFTIAMLNDDPDFIHHGPPGVWYEPGLEYSWEEHGSKVPTWKTAPVLKKQLALAWAKCYTENQKQAFFRDKLSVWTRPDQWERPDPAFEGESLDKIFTTVQTKASNFYMGVGIFPDSSKAYVAANDGRQLMIAQEIDLGAGDLDPLVDWLRTNARKFKLLRIPENQRGKALYQALADRGVVKTKMRLVSLPELSTSTARFFKLTADEQLKVYERDYVRIALSQFWVSFDQRSGSSMPDSDDPETKALVNSLVQACVEPKLIQRARDLNRNSRVDEELPEDDGSTPQKPAQPQRPAAKSFAW